MANTCSNTIFKPYLRPRLARYAANSFRELKKKTLKTGTAQRWHMRIGHPEPSALEHLINAFKGMKIKSPIII
jgi:hypothetical protein